MKRSVVWLVRKFWGLLAVVILLAAVVVQSGRQLAPLIEENKAQLERYFSGVVGAPVTSEQLSFNWSGLLPELKFAGLQVLNAEEKAVLSVKQAVAQVDFLRSLLSLELKIWHMSLEGVRASLTQADDESWHLIRSPSAVPAKSGGATPAKPLNALLSARDIFFRDVEIAYAFNTGRDYSFTVTSMSLQNQEGFHRLNASLDLPDQSNAVVLMLEGEGSINNWRDFDGAGYLRINNYQLRDSVAIASQQASLWQGVRDTRLNAKVWADFTPGEPMQIKGSLQATRADGGAYDHLPSWLDTDLWGYWSSSRDWQLQLQSLQFEHDLNQRAPQDFVFGRNSRDSYTLFAPAVDLEFWGQWLPRSKLLPERANAIVETLAPQGRLRNLLVELPLADPANFVATSNIEQASANAWQGVPQIGGLNGYLEVRKQWGMVQIDSPDYFLMHYPRVYHTPFEFDRAQGAVAWRFDKSANEVFVNSSLLSFEGGLGQVNGYFALDTPYFAKTRPSDMTLHIGLQNSLAKAHELLVPYTAPESLQQWLDRAIVDGGVAQAGFIYRGSIRKDSPNKTLQLGMEIEGGELDYAPGWPRAKNFDATLLIDDRLLLADVERGEFLQSQLENVAVHMDDNPQGEGPLLAIDGELQGPAQDLLRVLTQSPLRDTLGSGFDDWSMQGNMQAEIKLTVPLQKQQPGLTQDIRARFENASLNIENLNLPVEALMGELHYSSRDGLRSPGLVGSLWGKPLVAAISTSSDIAKMARINLKTRADMQQLGQWSRRPEVLFATGETEVVGDILVPLAGRGRHDPLVALKFESGLAGVQVNLPAPYGKAADESRELLFAMDIFPGRTIYNIDYDNKIDAQLSSTSAGPVFGEVALMSRRNRNPTQDIWLTGEQQWLSKSALFSLIDNYQDHARRIAQPDTPAASSVAAPLLKFDALIKKFQWDNIDFEDLNIAGGQAASGWQLNLHNPMFKGALSLYDSGQPIGVALQYLKLPEPFHASDGDAQASAAGVSQDLLAELNPGEVEAADVSVEQLRIGDEDYGSWSFSLRPQKRGLVIDSINGTIRGVRVSAAAEMENSGGARIEWLSEAAGHHTRFQGALLSTDVADVLQQWQQPALLESKSAMAELNLKWAGTPLAFDIKTVSGTVRLRADDGRFIRSAVDAESAFLRLVGLFNFDTWVRRLQLDFSDVYRSGLAYDSIRGEVSFDSGQLQMIKPIKVKTPSSTMQMGGKINLLDETLDATMVATLPVGGNATTAAALVGGLPAAAGVYLIRKMFDKQIKRLTSISYTIEGPWAQPRVKFHKLFDEKGAKDAGKKVQKQSSVSRPQEPAS